MGGRGGGGVDWDCRNRNIENEGDMILGYQCRKIGRNMSEFISV